MGKVGNSGGKGFDDGERLRRLTPAEQEDAAPAPSTGECENETAEEGRLRLELGKAHARIAELEREADARRLRIENDAVRLEAARAAGGGTSA